MGRIWHLALLHWVNGNDDADGFEKEIGHGGAYGDRVYSKWLYAHEIGAPGTRYTVLVLVAICLEDERKNTKRIFKS